MKYQVGDSFIIKSVEAVKEKLSQSYLAMFIHHIDKLVGTECEIKGIDTQSNTYTVMFQIYTRLDTYLYCTINNFTEQDLDSMRGLIEKEECKEEQSDLEYYTSKEFNLFETVHFLKEHPDWTAEREGGQYYIDTYDNVLNTIIGNKSYGIHISPDTLNWKFKLLPPEEKEEWVDCKSVEDAIDKLEEGYDVRTINKEDNTVYHTFNSNKLIGLQELYYSILFKYKWQYLKK